MEEMEANSMVGFLCFDLSLNDDAMQLIIIIINCSIRGGIASFLCR